MKGITEVMGISSLSTQPDLQDDEARFEQLSLIRARQSLQIRARCCDVGIQPLECLHQAGLLLYEGGLRQGLTVRTRLALHRVYDAYIIGLQQYKGL